MPPECKLIVFDLDGVLWDAKQIHFNALNLALAEVDPKYMISSTDHINKYDGLPTYVKLSKLTHERGLDSTMWDRIAARKQEITQEFIRETKFDKQKHDMIKQLKEDGFHIAVASNSVHNTIIMALERLGLLALVDFVIGNDDLQNSKPNPEMYLRAMVRFSVAPSETLIVEDSEVGRRAAIASGANLCPVNGVSDVTYELISRYAGNVSAKVGQWKDENLNILIPMCGLGSRFENAGYTFPKPLIEVRGKPMIQVVVENLNIDANYIFIVRKEHYQKYNLKYLFNLMVPKCEIVVLNYVPEGAALTTLEAVNYIDNDKQLLIANSDQFLEWDSSNFMYTVTSRTDLKGVIPVFEATHPKWSFVKTDDAGFVKEVAEKKPISNLATAGIYYWRHGYDYVRAAQAMTDKDIRTNGEFYIAPAYNEIITPPGNAGYKKVVGIYKFNKMWGLGTPEDLEIFLNGYTG